MAYLQKSKIMLTAFAILGFAASPSFATTFDAAADFSITNNPNGIWQYGWSSTLGSDFNLLNTTDNLCGTIDRYYEPAYYFGPSVFRNNGNALDCGTGSFQAGQLGLHPGPNGEYAILRWVASQTGNYSISTMFAGVDVVGTTTDVHILHNGTSLFSELVNGFGVDSAKSFATDLLVNVGDVIDFAVGYSTGGWWYDSTGLNATISSATPPESVPEPASTLGLLALGTFGVSPLLKRKQQGLGTSFK